MGFTLVARALALAVVASLLALVPTAPAQAALSHVRGINGVLYDTCRYHQFRYDVSGTAYDWDLEVDLYDSRGVAVDWAWLNSTSDPASGKTRGSDGFHFCGWERPGRYTMKATLTRYDHNYNSTTERFTSSFTMRRPRTRTSLRVNDRTPRSGQVLRFRARSTAEYPKGYFAKDFARVVLQRKTGRGWKRVRAGYTNRRGVAAFRVRWRRGDSRRLRAVTKSDVPFAASRSRVVRLR